MLPIPGPKVRKDNPDHYLLCEDVTEHAFQEMAEQTGWDCDEVATALVLTRASHGLMANDYAAGGQQIFDRPQAEWKSEMQPDRVANELGEKPLNRDKRNSEPDAYRGSCLRADTGVNVTMPLVFAAFFVVIELLEENNTLIVRALSIVPIVG